MGCVEKWGRTGEFRRAILHGGPDAFGYLMGCSGAGALTGRIGAPWTVFIGGMACLGGAAVFARGLPRLREKVRPIYVKQGILPEIAVGIQTATELTLAERSSRAKSDNDQSTTRNQM